MLMLLLLILIGTTENPNIEYRNPKQIEKIQIQKFQNRSAGSRAFGTLRFGNCFEFRVSDFGFCASRLGWQ
jgi:hypothetical protein